ncbi:MAG TPA: glycosyltransferase family 1 protein [Burkholderiaceae bacterium]|jgi:glycosyltransferase involved in cell wall biosynthesis
MKIAFDPGIFASQKFGGISRYFYQLANHFEAMDEALRVMAPFHFNEYLGALPGHVVRGRNVGRWPSPLKRHLLRLNAVSFDWQVARWQPQLIHETYYSGQVGKHAKSAYVVTIHDMIHELYPAEFPDGERVAALKRQAVLHADHVVCVSQSTRRDLIALLDVPDAKISVIHHGVDQLATVGQAVACEGQRPFLLYVGHRGGYKNFSSLVKAVGASPMLRRDFSIIAFGGGPFTVDEQNLFKACKLEDGQVLQRGGADALLAHLYESAAAFVYPSMYEGFGMPPLEAMARNCPVVSSNTSSMPEVIGDAAAFFDPGSIDELRIALEQTLYADMVRRDLIEKGRQRVKHFAWAQCARDTLRAYRRVAR